MRAYSRTFLPVEVGQRSNSGGLKMTDSIPEKLSEGGGAGGCGASLGGRNRRMAARAGQGASADAPVE